MLPLQSDFKIESNMKGRAVQSEHIKMRGIVMQTIDGIKCCFDGLCVDNTQKIVDLRHKYAGRIDAIVIEQKYQHLIYQ